MRSVKCDVFYCLFTLTCHEKNGPPKMVPPGPNTLKYLDPLVRVLQNSTGVFGPPLK